MHDLLFGLVVSATVLVPFAATVTLAAVALTSD